MGVVRRLLFLNLSAYGKDLVLDVVRVGVESEKFYWRIFMSNVKQKMKSTETIKTLIYRGKTQFIWGAYFVINNSDMSIFGYIYFKFLQLILSLLKSLINKNKLFEGIGIIQGFILVLPALVGTKNFKNIMENNT